MVHNEDNELDDEEDGLPQTLPEERLKELTVRGGSYVLLFLTFAPLAAVTILQIPTDVPGTKYMIHPSVQILDALKLWMVAVIPIFGSILPMTELLRHVLRLSIPTSLVVARVIKIVLIWTGALVCIWGILKFLQGI
jgi:hypothetical protein